MMKQSLHALCFLVVGLLFVGCTSTPTLEEQILGSWQGSIQGFDVTLIFAEEEITVDGFGMSFPYTLEGDQISMEIPGQGTMKATVEINGDEMVQTDANSGEKNIFTRKI